MDIKFIAYAIKFDSWQHFYKENPRNYKNMTQFHMASVPPGLQGSRECLYLQWGNMGIII